MEDRKQFSSFFLHENQPIRIFKAYAFNVLNSFVSEYSISFRNK